MELQQIGKVVTMDSREIAELTKDIEDVKPKRHSDICRDIRNQLDKQKINERNFASVYIDKKNESRTCFKLDYEQTMILLSGYSIPLRAKVIKRWNELEQQSKPSYQIDDPIKRAERWIEEQKQVQQLSVKAQVAEELANTEGLYLPSDAGKIITGHPKLFCKWLVEEKIMFYRRDKLIPMARYTDKYFEVKISKYKNKSTIQSYFTARGLAWIQAKYLKLNDQLQLDYAK